MLTRRYWTAEVRGRLAGGETGSVLICDVDHFKAVNDDHGHLTGDLVLTEVARVLQRHGLAGRLGGDEFVLYTAETGAAALASPRRSCEEIRLSFGDAAEPSLRVAVSIGLACAPGPGLGPQRADAQRRRRAVRRQARRPRPRGDGRDRPLA